MSSDTLRPPSGWLAAVQAGTCEVIAHAMGRGGHPLAAELAAVMHAVVGGSCTAG